MNFKSLEEIKSLTDQELLEYVVLLKETPELEIQYLTDSDNIEQDEYEYSFDEIKTKIRFDSINHKMYVPHVDEREHDIFQKIIFSNSNKKDRFPSVKFLNLVDATVQNELLGIATFTFGYYKIIRKFSDYRFINKSRVQEQVETYLFNYETKKFEQIDIKDKNSPKLEEYNKRVEIIKYIKKRLKRLDFKYLESLDKQLFYKRKSNSKEEIQAYLQHTYNFLEGSFPTGMLVKKLFFNITSKEYEVLINESKNILERIEILQEELNEIADGTNLTQEQTLHFTKEKYFFSEKPEKTDEFGFFTYEGEEYANVAQVEKRNYLTDYPANELQQALEPLTDEEQLIQEIGRIFDIEELQAIEDIINDEENQHITPFKLAFFKFIESKKLPPEKRSAYTDYFFNKNKPKSE